MTRPFAILMACLLFLSRAGCGTANSTSPPASAREGSEDAGEQRGISEDDTSALAEGSSTEPRRKSSLPDFELETLRGDVMRLSDQIGKKVILIDFWATFCDPCLVAMPHLNRLYEKYKDDGFVILGVSIDGPQSMSRVRSEVRKLGVTFPILLDPESDALGLYNPKASAPYSVLIDRKGTIIKRKEGFTPSDVDALEQAISGAL